jgi:hypothetical protein
VYSVAGQVKHPPKACPACLFACLHQKGALFWCATEFVIHLGACNFATLYYFRNKSGKTLGKTIV